MSLDPFPQRSGFGIDYNRRLTKEQQASVRHKWLAASMARSRNRLAPEPDLGEVCWADDYKAVSVRVESGVLECGFRDSGIRPIGKLGEHHLIFAINNPGAASLLRAIESTITGRHMPPEEGRAINGTHG